MQAPTLSDMAARSRAAGTLLAAALAMCLLAQAHGLQEDLAAPAPAEAAAAAPAPTEAALPPSSYDGVSVDTGLVALAVGEQECMPAYNTCVTTCGDQDPGPLGVAFVSPLSYQICINGCECVHSPVCLRGLRACDMHTCAACAPSGGGRLGEAATPWHPAPVLTATTRAAPAPCRPAGFQAVLVLHTTLHPVQGGPHGLAAA